MILLLALHSFAEEVRIPIGKHVEQSGIDLPRTGMSKQMVLDHYGEPQSQHGPTGEPPISYWEYPKYTVYFEYSHVIHSVLKSMPK